MSNWEALENNCYEKILKDYGKFAQILPHGKSDSTKPDIEVILPNGKNFFLKSNQEMHNVVSLYYFQKMKQKPFVFLKEIKWKKTLHV